MSRQIELFCRPSRRKFIAGLFSLILLLAGCGGDGGSAPVIQATVEAASGGTFSDSGTQPDISVTIPPGALSGDAVLTITRAANLPEVGANQTAAGRAFALRLTAGSGGGAVTLNEPLVLEMRADPGPVHPQVGEIASLQGTDWQRLSANFFRASDSNVVALSSGTEGTFRVVHRSLQSATGPGVAAGFDVFQHETFGNEDFFGGVVGLHQVLNNVAPADAVALGAQVDLAKVPQAIVDVMVGSDLAAKDAALADPAVTRQLIKAGAVIGVEGVYATADPADDTLISVGLTCALCHLNVTPTQFELSSGPAELPIGPLQVDGVPNAKMDAGAILAATPFAVSAGQATVDLLNSWGPGRFDIRALPDNPLEDGVNNPTDNPPIWNFVDLEQQGYQLGWDGLFEGADALASQAEAVYDLVMHGNGAFATAEGNLTPALSVTPPQALVDELVAAEVADPGNNIDTQALLDLQEWMRSLVSPAPENFDEAMAEEGFKLFYGKANCSACHHSAEYTGPGLFTDITATPPAGDLSAGIRVPGLRGVSHTAPYFHDHSAATLAEAVSRLVERGGAVPALTAAEQAALVEYLKSL